MSKKTARRKVRNESVVSTPAPVAARAPGKSFEFNPDYSYVIKDLRRIGALAGIFISILVVLSFFLR